MTAFTHSTRVHFGQIDGAMIVFYPRYFEMINETVETWFREALDYGFPAMHGEHSCGVPTVDIRTKFLKPVRLEQVIDWTLRVAKLSNRSVTLNVEARVEGEVHVSAEAVLVHVNIEGDEAIGSAPWPDAVRAKMEAFLMPAEVAAQAV